MQLKDLAPNLIQEAPIAWLIIERESKNIVFCSDELCHLTGYEREELVDDDLKKLLPQYIRANHDTLVDSFFEKRTTRRMGSNASALSIVNKAGDDVPVKIAIAPVNGKGIYAAAYIFDVSDITIAKDEVEKAKEELEDLNYQLTQANKKQASELEILQSKSKAKNQSKIVTACVYGSAAILIFMFGYYALELFFGDKAEAAMQHGFTIITFIAGQIFGIFSAVMAVEKIRNNEQQPTSKEEDGDSSLY